MAKGLGMFAMVYGRRLRTARLNAGVTQAAVAKVINRQQSYVSKVEHGLGMFRPFDYPRVAALLGVSVLDLIGPFTDEENAEVEEEKAKFAAEKARAEHSHDDLPRRGAAARQAAARRRDSSV